MIILSWNCRGLAQSSTIRELRAMIRRNHPDIIFLLETKTNLACSILPQLGYSLSVQAPPSGSRGGLLIAWHSDIKLTSLFVSPNLICVHYFSNSPDVQCLISFVYGPPYQKHGYDFWSQLAEFGSDSSVPWLCIGDFNSITSSLDKLGGRPFNGCSKNDFGHFMNSFGMIDLGFSCNPFTWSNHRQGHGLIKERLDRGICCANYNYSQVHESFCNIVLCKYEVDPIGNCAMKISFYLN